MIRCAHCGSALDATGRCPGDAPLLDPHRDGRKYGTAAQLVHRLGSDVTTDMIHNWRKRDGLERYRIGREVYSPLDQAATIERDKRLQTEETGRGRRRRLDVTPVLAA
ncbi:hypothetical protein ACH4T9_31265 [Micromonospora sp. NPDC020750]|uniref:hypothetical protein n=1 Tax=unclassified Micromonospora TaxID=2617518 RepID=UPI0037A4C550